jgi:hypothetical protein
MDWFPALVTRRDRLLMTKTIILPGQSKEEIQRARRRGD